jgi:uncharacterized repeat protein (TIGR03803 family)
VDKKSKNKKVRKMRYSKFIWKFLPSILLSACCVAAQTGRTEAAFQVLCEFPISSNTAPLTPNSALVEIGNGNFYGTTTVGGTNNNGTVFEVTSSGVLTPVFAFNGFDGSSPFGVTLGENGDLYGTTISGGPSSSGTIFEVSTNGVFKPLATNGNFTSFFFFGGANGRSPNGKLILGNDGSFYGTTRSGGSSSGNGTIFTITTNGIFTVLWQFNGTNGSQPYAGLTLGDDGNFYGTTAYGGSNYSGVNTGNGTVFQITTNGVLTTLAFFTGTNGSNPMSGLAQGSDGKFYGTTYSGGTFNLGTVFQITTNGNLTTLLSFDGTNGSNPFGGLTQGSDGNFYGTTAFSAPNGTNYGTIFRIKTNGTLTTLIYLNGTNGLHPFTDMILGHDGKLYGAMDDVNGHQLLDGSWGNIFGLVQQPVVAVASQNGGAILSWTSFTNQIYQVEYKSSLTDAIWAPLITNTASSNTTSFTNSFSNATQRFYRIVLP